MTSGFTPLRGQVLDLLVDAGTWVSRDELNTLSTCAPAVDDAIADLVIEGLAEHRKNVGYRLAATEACRRALQLQRRTGKATVAVGQPGRDAYRVGVVETLPGRGRVAYELELPNPQPGPDALQVHLAQVQGVIDFIHSRGGPDA